MYVLQLKVDFRLILILNQVDSQFPLFPNHYLWVIKEMQPEIKFNL